MVEREKDELNKKIGNMVLASAILSHRELKKLKKDLIEIQVGKYLKVIERKDGTKINVSLVVDDRSRCIAITVFDLLEYSLSEGMLHKWVLDKKLKLANIVLPKKCN